MVCFFLIVLLAGCSSKHDQNRHGTGGTYCKTGRLQWMPISEQAGKAWGVSPRLMRRSLPWNPALRLSADRRGAVRQGLNHQGERVYRYMGWRGQPSTSELKNPERNISMGWPI